MGACPYAGEGHRQTRRGAGPGRSAKGFRLVGGGETPLGRGHARPLAASGGAARLRAAAGAARAGRKPGWTFRDAAPAALVLRRDAHRLRLYTRAIPLLRRLSWRGAAETRSAALAALSARCIGGNDDRARRAVA